MKMKNTIWTIIVAGLMAAGAYALADVNYPVPELGNCADQVACKTFCDEPENATTCLDFAKKNQLMSEAEIRAAEAVLKDKGPGGCTDKNQCETYCDDVAHIDECVAFAEQHGLMDGAELQEARKVQAAIKQGIKPPPCGGKKKCDDYCSDVNHLEECLTFAKAAGLMDETEMQEAEKMLTAVRKGIKPPPCRNKTDCDAYCSDEGHWEECLTFAEAAGFMTPEEAAMARKIGGQGPGGCRGKEECDAYCQDHEEECMNFALEHDLIKPEERGRMEEGKKQMMDALNQAPPELAECLKNTVGAEVLDQIRTGTKPPSRELGDKMQTCFEKLRGSEEFSGPSGGRFSPPPEVKSCLEARGINLDNLQGPPGPELEEKMRGCFQQNFGSSGGEMEERPPEGDHRPPGAPFDASTEGVRREIFQGEENRIREQVEQEWQARGEMMPSPGDYPPSEGFSPMPPPTDDQSLPPSSELPPLPTTLRPPSLLDFVASAIFLFFPAID